MTTIGGLLLSLACAVLVEELFLGGLFRLFFAPKPDGEQKRSSGRVR